MDSFRTSDLKRLVDTSADALVSLYMPTHRTGRDVRQNPIRFKNLISTVSDRLADAGLKHDRIAAQVAEAAKLEADSYFWQHQADGLAMFLSADGFERYRLPVEFEELAVVAPQFHVTPLVPMLAGDGRFYILAVSQNVVRFLVATRYHVAELEPAGLPSDLRSALRVDEYVRSLQQHTTDARRGHSGGTQFHGHGASDLDVKKRDELLEYFRSIDAALRGYFHEGKSPLVFAGVDYLFPIFQEASDYPGLLPEPVPGNPDELSVEALHERSWSLVAPVFGRDRDAAVGRYEELAASDKTSAELETIVRVAPEGAIDILFVASGAHVWGSIDPSSGAILPREKDDRDSKDLLNCAAVHTLANRGTVYSLQAERMPSGSQAAAIFRYPVPSV